MKKRMLTLLFTLGAVLSLFLFSAGAANQSLGLKTMGYIEGSDTYYEAGSFQTSYGLTAFHSDIVAFYSGTGSDHHSLTGITDVTTSDPSVLTVVYHDTTSSGQIVYRMEAHSAGSASIIVTTSSGTVYTAPVNISWPALVAYSQPVADPQYLVGSEFPLSSTTFYLFDPYGDPVGDNDTLTVQDVYFSDSYSNSSYCSFFDVSVAADKSCYVVNILETYGMTGTRPSFLLTRDGATPVAVEYITLTTPADPSTIGYVYTWYGDNDQIEYDTYFEDQFHLEMGSSHRVAFVYGSENSYNILTNVTDVTSANEDVVSVELRDEDGNVKIWRISGESLGTTTLTVTTASGTYTIPAEVELPTLGIFEQPTRDAQYLITDEFTFTDSNKTFYFILDHRNAGIADVYPEDSAYKDNFKFTFTPGSSLVKVEIVDTAGLNDEWVNFRCQLSDTSGNTTNWGTWGCGLRFVNGNPLPGLKYARYNNGEAEIWSDFRANLNDGIASSPLVVFYHGTEDNHTPITGITSVTVADPTRAAVYLADETTADGLPAYEIDFLKPGTTELIVTTASETYRIPFQINLYSPWIFSEPVFDSEKAITSFTITETADTFYYVAKSGHSLTGVTITDEQFEDAFTITKVSGTVYKLQVTNPTLITSGRYVGIRADYINENGNANDFSAWVKIINNKPAPGFTHLEWNDDDELIPQDRFMSAVSTSIGSNPGFVFFHGTSDNYSALDVTGVALADPAFGTVEYWRDTKDGLPAYTIDFKKVGSTEIIVTTPSATYRIPVTSKIYSGYFFPTAVYNEAAAITSFDVTETADTFYFVAQSGNTIEDIWLNNTDYAHLFRFDIAADKSYAAIKVLDPTGLPNWKLNFRVALSDGDDTWNNGYGFRVNNAVPSLIAEYVDFWDNEVRPTGDHITSMEQSLYSYPAFLFHYGTMASSTPLTGVTSVTLADPSLAVITSVTDQNGVTAWFVDPQKTGTTTLTVTAGGKSYSMPLTIDFPYLGVYTSPTISASTILLHGVEWSDTNKTFYLMLRDPDARFTGITASDYNDHFKYTIADDGSYVKVEIVNGTGLENSYTRFTAEITNDDGDTWTSNLGCSFTRVVTMDPLPNAPVAPTARPEIHNPNDHSVAVSLPVENTTAANTTVNAMLAIYNEHGKMLGIRMAAITLAPNGTDVVELVIDISGMDDAHHGKLFLTDSNNAPCATVFEFN